MSNETVLLHKGDRFQSTGLGKFVKDILPQGVFIHPDTGQIVDYSDPKRLQALANNTTKYRRAGNKVPFPDGHKFDAMSNLGDWDEEFIVRDGRLWGMVNPRGKDVEERLASGKIDGVSAFIKRNVKDALGNVYPEVILHVCATDYPVIPGQGSFKAVAMSRTGEELPLYLSKEIAEGMSPEGKQKEAPMFKAIALALGIAEDADEAKVLAAIKTRDEEQKTALAKIKASEDGAVALAVELKANGLEQKDGKLVKLAAPPPAEDDAEKKALRQENDLLKLARAKDKLAFAKSKAESLIKLGLVPPAQKEALQNLFALKDQAEAMALSADGKTVTGVPVDPIALFDEIMKNVRSIVGTPLSRMKPAADGEPKEKTGEELEKEGAQLAREAQGKKETA